MAGLGLQEAESRIQKAFETGATELSLSDLGLAFLPKSIGKLSTLQKLSCRKNKLTSLPPQIGSLNNLRELYIQNNQITELPESICQLNKLEKLTLNKNKLTGLPTSIGELKNLQELNIHKNQISSLPESLGNLVNLKKLSLMRNKLSSLPKVIGKLKNLEELNLDRNLLTELPEDIGSLINLKILTIVNNKLLKLSDAIGNLVNLQTLTLNQNQLFALPEAISELTSLQILDLSQNHLTSLPERLGDLSNLRSFDVSNNLLSKLPETIGKLKSLYKLHLKYNSLQNLPDSIGNLTDLKRFAAHKNQLVSLPESIGNLINVQYLSLANNRLTSLPESLGNMTSLRILALHKNQLTSLPSTLNKLSNLTELFLHNNPDLGLPVELLGPDQSSIITEKRIPFKPAEILDYYYRLMGSGRRALNEAKLILVGYGAVGKSSLVERLVHDAFDKDKKKTEGIQIIQWAIRLNGEEDIRLNIWDFGGQEIMHSTHQFFLTQRSLYLLVLNGRQGHEDADAEYWLSLIRSFGEDSPVIIVLNKIREQPFDLNRRGLKQKYPFIRDFVETDCEERTGIDDLRKLIERETDMLEHLRDAFPASWFSIKDELAGMKENYLTFERFRAICADKGEKDSLSQESLAYYLHNLGIALNYKDDPRLRDTHVLNPHWVTNGIYKVLNAEYLARQKGELRVEDLSRMLDPEDYPHEKHSFILELMRKFELCFSFPEDNGRYLVPELLDKQQPAEAEDFKPSECLNFQYHYPILPEGLLPRFIVRTHSLSTGQPRWKTGVILKFEDNVALVKGDIQAKKVFINVHGSVPSRRRLLAVIRSDFEHINSTFKFHPEEMIPVPGHTDELVPYQKLLVMEKKGLKSFPVVIDDDVLELDVQSLLNGVDLEGMRKKDEEDTEETAKYLRLFYSYSHKDESLRDELETHLKLLERQGLIVSWHDRRISAGDDWKGRIDENLERADIILLLVSADFIASDYCYDVEMKRALERHNIGEALIVPVVVRDVNWHTAPFGKLQALPKDGKAVKVWADRDTAWRNVSEGIARIIKDLRQS